MQARTHVVVEAGRWLPLIPDVVASLPETSAVFEVASLVRHVLYVGRGEGNLQARLTALARHPGGQLPPRVGGYWFRYHPTDAAAEADTARAILDAYRRVHDGRTPPANAADPHATPPSERHAA